ncbi:MAG: tetratricopeptide repeat protein [Bacteroidetes bacterium]|nr:tetratricopeptide repeat protein [Bacteroidota bacterium]
MIARQRFLAFTLLSCVLLFQSCSNNEPNVTHVAGIELPNILASDTASGAKGEQLLLQKEFEHAIAALRNNQDDAQPLLDLGGIYFQEARITGNQDYYTPAALQVLDRALDLAAINSIQKTYAFSLKSSLYLWMNQYQAAWDLAKEGVALSPNDPGIWGTLTDANIAMGYYTDAVKTADKMTSIRPDLRSYSRIALLRQTYGDIPGAIDAMKLAVDAGVPSMEATEWARVAIGNLYLQAGKPDSADTYFRTALRQSPRYAVAELGLARMYACTGDYDSAAIFAHNACASTPNATNELFLAQLYRWKGDATAAEKLANTCIEKLNTKSNTASKTKKLPNNTASELALAYYLRNDLKNALKYAKKDLELHPENQEANELLGWLYYLNGSAKGALPFIEKSLSTGSKNPSTLYRAGLIIRDAGEATRGNILLQDATNSFPNTDPKVLGNLF